MRLPHAVYTCSYHSFIKSILISGTQSDYYSNIMYYIYFVRYVCIYIAITLQLKTT